MTAVHVTSFQQAEKLGSRFGSASVIGTSVSPAISSDQVAFRTTTSHPSEKAETRSLSIGDTAKSTFQVIRSAQDNTVKTARDYVKKLPGVVTVVEDSSVECEISLPSISNKMTLRLPRVLFDEKIFRGYQFDIEHMPGPYAYPKISPRVVSDNSGCTIIAEMQELMDRL